MTDCPQCAELRRLLTQAEEAQAELATQLAGREHQLARAGADYIKVKRKLDKLEQGEPDDPDVEPHVERLLKLWVQLHRGGSDRHVISSDSSRAAQVRRMLKTYSKKAPRGTEKRSKFVYAADRLENAIRGATLDDWAMGRIRKSGGKSFTDIEHHILENIHSTETFEGLWLTRGAVNVTPGAVKTSPVTPIAPAKVDALPEYAEEKVKTYVTMLGRDFKVRARIKEVKGWSLTTLQRLEVGWDGVAQRFTFPVRDKDGRLINVVRYVPGGKPKSIGVKGQPRDLFPAPETIPPCETCKGWGCLTCPEGPDVWLVEGEPDAITGWEMGLPTVSVPGTGGWRPEYGERFAMPGRRVVIVPDCDPEGRASAQRIAASLLGMTAHVKVIDLDPSRDDKWDLGDAHMAGVTADDLRKLAAEAPVVQALKEAA